MTIEELKKYKKILIAGYGQEGKATERFLKRFHSDVEILITDQKYGPGYLNKQNDADLVIKTPGIPSHRLTTLHTTATNIFFGNCKVPIIGITGTRGKSTACTLLYQTLKRAGMNIYFAGNIGSPMLEAITDDILQNVDYVVLELSSYQCEDLQYSPHIGVILNIAEGHLDYHKGFENYKKAKAQLVKHASADDFYVYNSEPSEGDLENIETNALKVPFEHSPFTKAGIHQSTQDAVFTIMSLLKLDTSVIQKSLDAFDSLPHRLFYVGTYKNIRFIDDSASKVPTSTIFALNDVKNIDTLILGGLQREHTFEDLTDKIVATHIRNVILMPDIIDPIEKSLSKKDPHIQVFHAQTMDEAVNIAYRETREGSTCLLSPGFASYNAYANFNDRGDDFQKYVKLYA